MTQNLTPTHASHELTQTTCDKRAGNGYNARSNSRTHSAAVGGSSSTPISAQEKQKTTAQPQKYAAHVPGRHRNLPTEGGSLKERDFRTGGRCEGNTHAHCAMVRRRRDAAENR